MRQIQEVKKLTGGRYRILLTDGVYFPLYRKELDEFGICEDGDLPEEDFGKIMSEVLPKRAKLCAMNFLQKTDRTKQQLQRKLEELFYPDEIIRQAVAYVESYHYIDDLRYAVNYMEYRRENRSMRQMEQELLRKGISRETFQEAARQMEAPDEDGQIRYWLEKKHFSDVKSDRREIERIFRFLLRRGYTVSAVRRAMNMQDVFD